MDTSLHSHIAAIHIQERMERASSERLAREVKRSRPRRLSRFRRRGLPVAQTGPAPTPRVAG